MMVVTASQIAAWTDAVRTLRWFHQVRFARLGLSRQQQPFAVSGPREGHRA